MTDKLTQGSERERESWLLGRTKASGSGREWVHVGSGASHMLWEETGWEVSDPRPCFYGQKEEGNHPATALCLLRGLHESTCVMNSGKLGQCPGCDCAPQLWVVVATGGEVGVGSTILETFH